MSTDRELPGTEHHQSFKLDEQSIGIEMMIHVIWTRGIWMLATWLCYRHSLAGRDKEEIK